MDVRVAQDLGKDRERGRQVEHLVGSSRAVMRPGDDSVHPGLVAVREIAQDGLVEQTVCVPQQRLPCAVLVRVVQAHQALWPGGARCLALRCGLQPVSAPLAHRVAD